MMNDDAGGHAANDDVGTFPLTPATELLFANFIGDRSILAFRS
jgi:hypothetical protein